MPSRLLACAAVLALAACAGLEVKEVGSFHVGGQAETLSGLPKREVAILPGAPPVQVDPNGEFEVGQMYVQYVRLAQPKARYPLLMWHGSGLTGVTWETKPDGAPGWQMFFLEAGFDVFVSDAVERGRASWARYPEIFRSEPFFRPKQEAWELFRIGPAGTFAADPVRRVTFPGQRFPTQSFDQFMKQGVPRWATNDTATQAAYDRLVEKVCPCIVIAHGQAGDFAYNAALGAPDRIKAVIVLEPFGAPDPTRGDLSRLKEIPHLFVWGDNIDRSERWSAMHRAQQRWHEALKAAGADSEWLDLPRFGIAGNTHMLMMDTNSDQVARLVRSWMNRKSLVR